MTKRRALLEYLLHGKTIRMWFLESGDCVRLEINGVDCTEDGEKLDHAIACIESEGFNLQADLSKEIDRQIFRDFHKTVETLAHGYQS